MAGVTDLVEWRALEAHARAMHDVQVRDLFAGDPERGERMHLAIAGWYVDYAKHRITDETLAGFAALADARDLRSRIDAMFRGDHVNVTEDRPALHVALRMPRGAQLVVDGSDVVAEVHTVLDRMGAFAERVRSGAWTGRTGRRIRAVVNIGIGGSDLGPAMAYDALRAYGADDIECRFVSNVDGADLVSNLHGLDPAETLFIVSSKTFTTIETLTNARSAREWCTGALGADAVAKHFVAVSTNAGAVAEFGIDTENMFEFWDWVGGRYSLWSAIGLSLMVAIGSEHFAALLSAAHEVDEHFRTMPWRENVPALMGFLTCWYHDFLGAQTHAVVPYAHVLGRLPSYLQQLEMESNGKSVDAEGAPVTVPTGEIVWGTAGTNGQHAYFQLLHQGNALVPVDFVGFARGQPRLELADHQRLLVGNLFAQAEALAFGTGDEQVEPYRYMPGNRPSTTFFADRLDPRTLGALIAMYEHKVMTLGTIWGIDSFDQWGVELGKKLAVRIAATLEGGDDGAGHDSSTRALLARYRDSWSDSSG
ncbi:MAG: glucose-6-phosphate isomerase [Acidimicrobiia bacterium]